MTQRKQPGRAARPTPATAAAAPPEVPRPPQAARIPHGVRGPQGHGSRNDDYYWLRDDHPRRKRREVMDYLLAENAYCDALLAPTAALQKKLLREMRARIREEDDSVPVHDRGYWYWHRYARGAEYPQHLRRRGGPDGPDADALEELLLDEDALAADRPYFDIGDWDVSPDNQWLAWTEDTVGRRIHRLRIKHIASGEVLDETIDGVLEDVIWAGDSRTLLYIRQDPQTLQSGPVYRHRRGDDPAADALVHDEPDRTLFVALGATASLRYLTITLSGFDTTELLTLPMDDPASAPAVALARRAGRRFDADHLHGRWVICSNEGAPNFRLLLAADDALGDPARWTELVAGRSDATIEDFELFDSAIVVQERVEANVQLRVLRWPGAAGGADAPPPFTVAADEPAFTMSLGANADPALPVLRYVYASLVTPLAEYEVDLAGGARRLLKQRAVPGYDPAQYESARLWAPARDGRRIPVSILWRRDRWRRDGTAPLYLTAYGAYGDPFDPVLPRDALSLVDRGFGYAIAHVRGGADLGEGWYEDGRLAHKQNSFDDFVAVTDFLVAERWAGPVFASGGSAGGLLIAAVANQAGDRYAGLSLWVPFVDVVTTMLDESIPLTANEWSQWGDPRRADDYARMLAWSPYDNIRAQPYPPMLVHAGLWDSQVQYFEPAKYVARLRATKTDANPLLLHTDLAAGHGGRSGRYAQLRDQAREFAFFLDLAGIRE